MTRAALVAAAFLVLAAPAGAEDVTRAELERLGARAATDARARERLRSVDSVDGMPVNLRRLLEGASPDEVAARVDAFAGSTAARPRFEGESPQAEAQEILAERRFQSSELPRPLRGVLDWIGDRLRPLGRPFDWLADRLPGGRATVWALLGALVTLVIFQVFWS